MVIYLKHFNKQNVVLIKKKLKIMYENLLFIDCRTIVIFVETRCYVSSVCTASKFYDFGTPILLRIYLLILKHLILANCCTTLNFFT